MRNPYRQLERMLGYGFRRRSRLELALTHRSFRYESPDLQADNQRLEFLGDAVLGLVCGGYLYDHFPDFQEGDLTRIRSALTNTRTLADIAHRINLGTYLRLGRGELQTGGQYRESNLSDALESVLGAAYIDGGLRAVQKIFRKIFVPEAEAAVRDRWQDNPKGALQEYCQRHWKASPQRMATAVARRWPIGGKVFTRASTPMCLDTRMP